MKRFRRSRDDGRFALTTLQNPTLEVRSLPQLIAAAQKNVAKKLARRGGTPPSPPPTAPRNKIPPVEQKCSHRNWTRRNHRHNNAHQEKTHFQSAWRSALYRRAKWNFAMSAAKTSLLPSLRSVTPPPAPGSPNTSRRNAPKLPGPPQPNPPPPPFLPAPPNPRSRPAPLPPKNQTNPHSPSRGPTPATRSPRTISGRITPAPLPPPIPLPARRPSRNLLRPTSTAIPAVA